MLARARTAGSLFASARGRKSLASSWKQVCENKKYVHARVFKEEGRRESQEIERVCESEKGYTYMG